MQNSGTTNRGIRTGRAALVLPLMLSGWLAGCGGGGGDGGGTPVANITVSGTVTYQRVPFSASGGGLDYNATFNAPVRGAVVEILPTGGGSPAPIVTTTTDASGAYSAQVGTGRSVFVRVKAQLQRSGGPPSWNFRVLNNTNSDALYAMDSAAFTTGTSNVTQNLNAASGWGGTSYTGTRVAAPFSLLDVAYETLNLVLSANANAVFAPLNIFWSPQNAPTPGNPDTGAIGTTSYVSGPDGGVFVLGLANVDTDEYDHHVIAHELGHYFQDVFSRDDSLGGPHSPGNRLDLRVAFSEGWGNAFSGMVKSDSRYRDSNSPQQASGFLIDVELNAAVGGNPGWFSEGSVQALVYDFFDSAVDGSDAVALGYAPIHQVMTADLRDSEPFTSIFSFVTALKMRNPGASPGIDVLAREQLIVANDALGTGETNDGGDPRNLPVYVPINLGDTVRVCSSTANGDYNGLGTRKFLRFTLPFARSVVMQATTVGAVTSDPDMVLHRDGEVARFESEVASREDSPPTLLQAGSYVLEAYEFRAIDPEPPATDGNTCMDVFVFGSV